MKSFTVTKADEGQSSLKYVQRILKESPNSFLYKMFRKKNIVLNGKKIEGNEKVKAGDEIKFFLSDETFDNFASSGTKNISLEEYRESFARFGKPDIVYEDSHIIILNKPVDMLSQKASNNDLSANEWLIGYLLNKKEVTKESLIKFMPSVCNRLDRNTGGLLLFGKTPYGTNTLNSLLRDRTLHKYYLTIVKGKITDKIKITGYLSKDEKSNKVTVSDKEFDNSSYIETEYYPIRYIEDKDITVLSVLLITGKPHQIRAHLAYMGNPILGDFKYGDSTINKAFRLNNQVLYAVKVIFPKIPDYEELSEATIEIETPDIFKRITE